MSDFWKKRGPRLSEEEERALWERVRTMPAEARGAARRRSPWSRPAVRFGAPVLAVALVAIVWVAQRAPEAPRPELPAAATTMQAPDAVAPQSGNSAPAIEMERAPAESEVLRERKDAPVATDDLKQAPAQPSRAGRADARDEAVAAKEETQTFAAPPAAAPAPAAEPTKVTVIKGAQQGTRAMAKSSSPETSSALGAAEGTAQRVITPMPPGPHATRVALLRDGKYLDRMCEEVVRPGVTGGFGTTVQLPFLQRYAHVQRVGGHWQILELMVLKDSLPPVGPLERRTALAAELDAAMRGGNSAAAERVQDAAFALQRERPTDEGVRALVDWAAAAITALEAN